MELMAGPSISNGCSERIFVYPRKISIGIGSIMPNQLSTSCSANSIAFFCRNGSRNAGLVGVRAMAASFGARMVEGVKKTVSENPVVVYSKTWCSWVSDQLIILLNFGFVWICVVLCVCVCCMRMESFCFV